MIRFCCPKCGKKLKAPPELAGKQVHCRCGLALPVPAEPVPASGPVPSANRSRIARKKAALLLGLGLGSLLLLGSIIFVVFLLPSTLSHKLQDLRGSDAVKSTMALQWFADNAPQEDQRPAVTAALETLLFDGDVHRNLNPDLLLRVYLNWAGKDNVPAMIRMVQNPTLPGWTPQKTGLVMEALGKLKDERAVDALAEKLPDPVLHDQAVNALSVLGPKAEPAVMDYLFHDDPQTRARAAQLLDGYGVRARTIASEARNRLRSSQAPDRRNALIWFLENDPSDDTTKAESAKLLVKLLDDPSADVRKQALEALKSWATPDTLPQLVEYARRQQTTASGDPALIAVLAQFPNPTAAEAIALQLATGPTRSRAVQALVKLGPAATNAVLPYLDDPDPNVQAAARNLARLLNIPADRQLDQILKDVASSSIPRSRAALENLAGLRVDAPHRATVSKALNAPLLDANGSMVDDALRAARVWGSPANTDALLQLLGNFDRGSVERNDRVIEILGLIKDAKAAPALARGLTLNHERGAVSQALRAVGPGAEDAVLPYVNSLDPITRFEATRLLGDIGTAKSLDGLQQALSKWGGEDPIFAREGLNARQMIQARAMPQPRE